jgi:hypothetical protein
LAVADGVAVAVAVAVARWVGEVVVVGLVVAVAREAGVALPVDVALALDVGLSVGVALAELLPAVPDEGDGVLDAPPEAVLPETSGVGVKTDGDGDGDPPPEQAATVTARMAAPAVARPARSSAARATEGPVSAGRGADGRIGAGQVVTGTVRRTFMKPPVMTGGQWRRPTHLSMCHPDRRRKRERAQQPAPVPGGRHNSSCRRVGRSDRQPHIAAPANGPAGGQWRVFHVDIRLRE